VRTAFFLLLGLVLALPARAEVCGDKAPPPPRLELGLAVESLIPSRLPELEVTFPVYGLLVSVPVGTNMVDLEMLLGGSQDVTVRIFETAYRLNVETPHFSGYAMAGAHLLFYSAPISDYTLIGGLLGLGIVVPLGERFHIDLLVKSYFQSRPIVALGGTFRLAL
jgi:hypothetical protein